MTCKTPLLHRIVLVLYLGKLLSHCLVAIEAKRIARLEKVVLIACGVGIMALHAIPLLNNLVGADTGGRDHAGMAGETDFFRIPFKKFPVGGSVRIVATCAIPFL